MPLRAPRACHYRHPRLPLRLPSATHRRRLPLAQRVEPLFSFTVRARGLNIPYERRVRMTRRRRSFERAALPPLPLQPPDVPAHRQALRTPACWDAHAYDMTFLPPAIPPLQPPSTSYLPLLWDWFAYCGAHLSEHLSRMVLVARFELIRITRFHGAAAALYLADTSPRGDVALRTFCSYGDLSNQRLLPCVYAHLGHLPVPSDTPTLPPFKLHFVLSAYLPLIPDLLWQNLQACIVPHGLGIFISSDTVTWDLLALTPVQT